MIKVLEKEEEFEKTLAENENVIVDFFATWCGPCKMMARVIEAIDEESKDVVFLKVDTDRFPSLALKYNVYSIPTLILFKRNQRAKFTTPTGVEDALIGYKDVEEFQAILTDSI